ncbi:hypothetical protein ABW21_db0201914 [Orbilia brochopaga]|nr:hypothetical protein ABW21_db0201914 [Drechslerella brochopaga]
MIATTFAPAPFIRKGTSAAFQDNPTNLYPYALGEKEKIYPNLIIVGGVNTTSSKLYGNQKGEWVKVFAPVTDIMLAQGKAEDYGEMTDVFLGILAILLSTYQYTTFQAKEKLYRLAYPRGENIERQQGNSPGNILNIYPPVVYNGLGQPPRLSRTTTLSQDRPESSPTSQISQDKNEPGRRPSYVSFAPATAITPTIEYCDDYDLRKLKAKRAAATSSGVAGDGSSTMQACIAARATTTSQPTTTTPALTFKYVYNATFCKVCIEADGVVPLNGVVWIPQDCPCRPEDIPGALH